PSASKRVNVIISRFDAEGGRHLSELLASARTSIGSAVSDISVKALGRISGFAAGIPGFVFELVFAVIAAFFFIADFEELMSFLKSRLPEKAVGFMRELRERSLGIAVRYVRSYALILLVTFGELSLGLTLIGAENAIFTAALIALLDILPVLGCGGILIPWALIELIRRQTFRGVGLLVLWAVIALVRSIIEPRIVGRQVGLHPLLTLAAMFVGTKLFGLVGLILLPAGLSVAVSVIREKDQSA
ncbi:MAG: AI-2E family transporter, partial [Ruminococcaceae bacterium]|nr:AI-2E family transporter [Oscillospiraceae bacterium]